jgi:serine/threonine protein kinase
MPLDPDQVETAFAPIAAPVAAASPINGAAHVPAPAPRPSGAAERFPPGTLLASRYRIVSRLGKGGMGEVFRADDLVLGQPVALKFLPESAKSNVNLLTRFYDEVRIARQISHKNVCRVYDIGEVDGQPYLSMEYIDGEDLGSLLRRIGRLPSDKAIEFARKLCAAVAAAHAQGVLHRDLKPANIMIDSRGELRVTDFGLAGIAAQLQGDEIRNGTPAYMAPEQLTGKEVSVQSDLYAVGLILYEMFTGRMPFEAETVAEMTRLRQESRITHPSALIGELDKTVERAILRCLEPDPKMRPVSALALSASLPGGDPLAAALAEGLTPSPELVAAAGSTEALSPKVAIPVLAAIFAGLAAFCLILPRVSLENLVPLEDPPEVLTAKARDILKSLGYTERPGDWTASFYGDATIFNFSRSKGKNMEEWSRLFAQSPSGIGFWYRQGRAPLAAVETSSEGEAGIADPPMIAPGMLTVVMDLDGSLRRFAAVPPEREAPPANPGPPDWTSLFAAAHLDPAKFTPMPPEWTAAVMTDARAAWTGPYRDRTDLNIRIEAASFHGRPVFFQILFPWTRPNRYTVEASTLTDKLRSLGVYALGILVLISALCFAYYNWKAGRGDLRGATRVGIYCAMFSLIGWAFDAHHVASEAEQGLIAYALAKAAYVFAQYWLVYLALEPWVRRYWPQSMITWSRVLAGRWRDPMVGRDILFGSLMGVGYLILLVLYQYGNLRAGAPISGEFEVDLLNGFHLFGGAEATLLYKEVGGALMSFLTLFLARAVLKKTWLFSSVFVIGWVGYRLLRQNFIDSRTLAVLSVLFWLLLIAGFVFILLRYGFFAFVVAVFFLDTEINDYHTPDFTTWYGGSSLAAILLACAIALIGFRLALGSKPLFSPAALEKA